jgi:membrane-associated phospholipid phosphatase
LRHHGQPRLPGWLLWSAVPAILLIIAFGLWLRLEARGPTPIDTSWLDLVGLDRDTFPYWIAVVLAEVGGGTGAVACTGVLAAIFALRRRFRSAGFLVTAMAAGICMSELLKAVVTRLRPIDQLYESTGFSYPSGHSMGAAALAVSLAIIAARAHGRRVRAAQAADTQSTAAQAAVTQAAAAQTADTQSTAAQAAVTQAAAAQTADTPATDADADDDTDPIPAPRLAFHWSFVPAAAWVLAMMWSRTGLQVHWLTDTIAGALIGIAAAVLVDELWSLLARRTRSPRLALWFEG